MSKPDRILLVALAVSLLGNVCLTYLWRQSRAVAPTFATAQLDAHTLPHAGARFGELRLLTPDGKKPDLRFGSDELPIVAYVLSPNCAFCELNQENINSLAAELQGRYRIVGISTTAQNLASYVVEKSPPFPVYYVDPNVSHSTIPLAVTPETLVFSSEGVFVQGWNGAYTEEIKGQLSTYFHIKISGCPTQQGLIAVAGR